MSKHNAQIEPGEQRKQGWRVEINGLVQGVGFRPFIFRLAKQHGLRGNVMNSPLGAVLKLWADVTELESFLKALQETLPAVAHIDQIKIHADNAQEEPVDFTIRTSETHTDVNTRLPLDLSLCRQCRQEVLDPENHRHGYAFISCEDCGPRFSILQQLPFDRHHTAMNDFPLCKACQQEYDNPDDRRFYSQTISCPECGPTLYFTDPQGQQLAKNQEAITLCCEKLRAGKIIALKGIGGFQLLADAANAQTVNLLRQRKHRPAKAFALMVRDTAEAAKLCHVSAAAQQLLESPATPIILARQKENTVGISTVVAPGLRYWGVMLPASALHLLIINQFAGPLIATSGNLSGEPLILDNEKALANLGEIADYFLMHNRTITHMMDDPVAFVDEQGQQHWLRHGRGTAPLTTHLNDRWKTTVAHGGLWKNSFAILDKQRLVLSQHFGDIDHRQVLHRRHNELKSYLRLIRINTDNTDSLGREYIDNHPELSEIASQNADSPPHHLAHAASVILSCELQNKAPVLCLCWDGLGYGPEQQLRGAEAFLYRGGADFQHSAGLYPIRLLGTDAARHCWRVAFSMGQELDVDIDIPVTRNELQTLKQQWRKQFNTADVSSMGRLFDGLSYLLSGCPENSYEAEAALRLESLAAESSTNIEGFQLKPITQEYLEIDWRPLFNSILDQLKKGSPKPALAYAFHQQLAELVLMLARHWQIKQVAAAGGVFHNQLLVKLCQQRLQENGIQFYLPRMIPAGDGGLSWGQAALHILQSGRSMDYVSRSTRSN